jgi:molybdopterin molybdotransferase
MNKRTITAQPNCEDELNTGLITVEEAQARIMADLSPVDETETVSLRKSLGRILAENIDSPIDVPAHTNSAVDGYAVHYDELPTEGTKTFKLIGTSSAGHPFTGNTEPGETVRIMTGAVVPSGMDAVVMQEFVEREEDAINMGSDHRPGQNVRQAGEDLKQGQRVFEPGRRINAADLGVLGSLGLEKISVTRRLKIAFFSTGDELRSVGEPLALGEIYDSNRHTMFGMLSRLNVEIIDMGVIRDSREPLEQAFKTAAETADLLITTGGVSVGDADYVTETLEKLGSTNFWKIAMKPGRPLAFGRVGDTAFFGLPGNPVSVMVTFIQFVRPAILKMAGCINAMDKLRLQVPAATPLRKRPGRTEYQRAVFSYDNEGQLVVSSTGGQGSGILSSMSTANCFIVMPADQLSVEVGDLVEVQPFLDIL